MDVLKSEYRRFARRGRWVLVLLDGAMSFYFLVLRFGHKGESVRLCHF